MKRFGRQWVVVHKRSTSETRLAYNKLTCTDGEQVVNYGHSLSCEAVVLNTLMLRLPDFGPIHQKPVVALGTKDVGVDNKMPVLKFDGERCGILAPF